LFNWQKLAQLIHQELCLPMHFKVIDELATRSCCFLQFPELNDFAKKKHNSRKLLGVAMNLATLQKVEGGGK